VESGALRPFQEQQQIMLEMRDAVMLWNN